MPAAVWKPSRFDIAMPCGPITKSGRVRSGLGLWRITSGSPKGKRPPRWSLTHLGTGHAVAIIDAHEPAALAIADEIADAGDWTFDDLQGYKNQFPDASEKVGAILSRHAKQAFRYGGQSNATIAREIAMARD